MCKLRPSNSPASHRKPTAEPSSSPGLLLYQSSGPQCPPVPHPSHTRAPTGAASSVQSPVHRRWPTLVLLFQGPLLCSSAKLTEGDGEIPFHKDNWTGDFESFLGLAEHHSAFDCQVGYSGAGLPACRCRERVGCGRSEPQNNYIS